MDDETKKRKKCWFFSYVIFSINLLVAGLVVLGIRHNEEGSLFSESVSNDEGFDPVKREVLDLQNDITTDRENKLRGLNNDPKELKQIDTTTTTTTTTTEEKKSDTKTKSS